MRLGFPLNRAVTCLLLLCTVSLADAQIRIETSNQQPRLDLNGKIVDAHDGRVIRFGKQFYWYGTRYGQTNGYTTANEYVCYSSEDLKTWKYEGVLLPQKPEGVYYRPHVIYNSRTRQYVLWYNWYPKLWEGQFGVAVSSSPTGPFRIVNADVKVRHSTLGVGDLGLFTDEDGQAYISYNTIQQHQVSVERLDKNYTASTLQGSEFIARHCEAGSMFKRNGIYYLLTDYTCCFCSHGSGAQVFTAPEPLGPYTWRQNINRYPGPALPLLTDGDASVNQFESLEAKNQNGLEGWFTEASPIRQLELIQFTGSRAGQCGEVSNPRTHEPIPVFTFDLQYFHDGEWHPLNAEQQPLRQSAMLQVYAFRFSPIQAERIRILPRYADTTQVLRLTEVKLTGAEGLRLYKTGRVDQRPIIPAQQLYVMEIPTPEGSRYSWMGDLWGSASDGIKGHDYQYWSSPLHFYGNGLIRPLSWTDHWELIIKN